MEKITCRQVIPNEAIEKTPNIVGYAVDMMVKALTKELGNILCDRKEYIVKMDSPTIRDAIEYNSTEYRARIEYRPLVRCKDCIWCHYEQDGDIYHCAKLFHRFYDADKHYCSYGERTDHE